MAGVMPFSGGTPGRKQWNIKDRKSSRQLRSELAEHGCPESQLVLAKRLLEEKNIVSVNDNEENARLGVFWLIKASEQGNVEATNILKKCLETGEGITEHNYLDVKECLSTSQNEKLAKRAAREMFLSLSAGQDFITSEQLRKRISKINICEAPSTSKSRERDQNLENDYLESEKKNEIDSNLNPKPRGDGDNIEFVENLDNSYLKSEKFNEKLTEDHLETAASNYSRGELPLVPGVLALSDVGNRQLRNSNFFRRTFFHPFMTIQQTHLRFLNHFSSSSRSSVLFLFSSSVNFQFFLFLLIYPFINFENLLLFLPMCIYYVSFFFMVTSTLQMLQSQREYNHFRVWSQLFLSYDRDGNLNTGDAEYEYCKKNLRPYGLYFLSLLFNLVMYPFISELWSPQSEFAIISFTFTFLTLYSFHQKSCKKIDFLLFFSFAVNVIAKYPYETDGVVRQTWRYLDIEMPSLQNYGFPCFACQVVGTGVEFCLNFRGFFYILIPGIFVKLASRDNWRGTYKVLIPHCVTLSWWQIAVFCCQGATLYGLLRSALAMVGLVFFLPLAGIATIILPIAAFFKHFADIAFSSKMGITIGVIFIPVLVGYYKRHFNLGSKFVKLQIFLAAASAMFLLSPSINSLINEISSKPEGEIQPKLSWDQYSSLCLKNSWDRRLDVEIQMNCVRFNGINVHWEGIVDNVKVVRVQNSLLKLLNNVPDGLRSKILCYYGEPYNKDCSEEESEIAMKTCIALNQINSRTKCQVDSWNKYDFDISIKMGSERWDGLESTIHLEADDSLKNFTMNLRAKDRVWFSGILIYPETIGSNSLKIFIEEIGCISCTNKNLTNAKRQFSKVTIQYAVKETYNGIKRILNFVFNPVINFR